MNAFEQMSKVLARSQSAKACVCVNPDTKPKSRVGVIRELLKSTGRKMSAAEIAFDVDLPSFNQNLVWLLLKYDIKKGRVLLSDGMYYWNEQFESAEAVAIRSAIKLLKKHGYEVMKGNAA